MRHPLRQLGNALIEILPGTEAEDPRGLRAVAKAVTDIADAALADDVRLNIVAIERTCDRLRHLLHAAVLAGADVDDLAVRIGVDERVRERARDVANIDEVAALLAILENQRPLSVQKPR